MIWSIHIQLNRSPVTHPKVPQETGADVLCVPQPGWDEWCGGPALQLPAHPEEAHAERRLRGMQATH